MQMMMIQIIQQIAEDADGYIIQRRYEPSGDQEGVSVPRCLGDPENESLRQV
jgi:hypothetical protein